MRRLTFPLDALPALREATGNRDVDLAAAASLAELAGVDAVRLTVTEELRPVRHQDVQEARRAAQNLELRMPPTQGALKVALEGRPDLVVLASESWDGHVSGCGPIDLRGRPAGLGPVLRSLGDGGIPAGLHLTGLCRLSSSVTCRHPDSSAGRPRGIDLTSRSPRLSSRGSLTATLSGLPATTGPHTLRDGRS